jgi:hypothetical protein
MNDGFYFLNNFVFFINFKFWPGSGSVFSNRLDPDPDPHSDPKHWYTNTNSFWFSWKYLGEGALVVLDSPAEDPHFVRMEDAVLLGPVLRCHLTHKRGYTGCEGYCRPFFKMVSCINR